MLDLAGRRRGSYLPRATAERLARGALEVPEAWTSSGAVLAADIVGFTRNVEEITESGPTGLDELAGALDAYFRALADVVHRHGGDILNVAGDAFLCCWPVESGIGLADATTRAAQAGLAVLEAVSAPTLHRRRFETRIGIGAGDLTTAFVGGWAGDWKLVATGQAVGEASTAEQRATPGRVLLTSTAAALLRSRCDLEPAEDGHETLIRITEPLAVVAAAERPPIADSTIRSLLPLPIRDRAEIEDATWLAELRTVTVVMAGLTGINHVDRAPLDVGHEAIRAFQAATAHYEGFAHVVLDSKGVTTLAAYGLPPLAHEDDAVRAVLAAQRVADDLRKLGLSFGIGVARGRAFCGAFGSDLRREYTVHGNVMNLAARLMTTACNEVLVDDEVVGAVGERFEFVTRDPIMVKGRSRAVTPSIPGTVRERSQHVGGAVLGRSVELKAVAKHVQRAGTEAAGVLVLEGEAGIGKSTLVQEGCKSAAARGVRVLLAAASSVEQSTSYFAWRSVFADVVTLDFLERTVDDDPDIERLLPLLGGIVPDAPAETPFTAPMEGDVRAENTRRILIALLRTAARERPTLLVAEDAHWFDSASSTLLVDAVSAIPELATIVATRQMSAAGSPLAPVLEQGTTTHVRLDALDVEAIERLVATQLGVDVAPEDLVEFVLRRTAGNPFFCVELVKTMLESGTIKIVGGVCEMADLTTVTVPVTVEGVVVSRLDRLDAGQSLAIKVAAVIGRSFLTDTVRAVFPRGARVTDPTENLTQVAELGFTIAEDEVGSAYRFGHDITREVAYGLLTDAQRRPLHLAVVDWYESSVEDLAPHVAMLAEHCSRAGSMARAVPYFEHAAHQALRQGAFAEAKRFFERALESEEGDVARRAIWTKGIGTAHYFLGDLAQSRVWYEQAVAALDRKIPKGRRARAQALAVNVGRQAAHLLFPGRYAGRKADRAATIEAAVDCYRTLGQIYFLDGEAPDILIYLTLAGLNVGEEAGPSPALARVVANAAVASGLVNLEKLARSYAQRAIAMAEAEGMHDASSYVWNVYTILLANWGQWEQAREASDKAYKFIFEVGDHNLEAEVWQTRAALEVCAGNYDAAEKAWAHTRELGLRAHNDQMYCWSLLDEVETSLGRGRVDNASVVLEEALQFPTAANDGSTEIEQAFAVAATRFAQGDHATAAAAASRAVEMVATQLPSAYPWPDFCAGAIEVQIGIAASRSQYGQAHRDELLHNATRGARAIKKVSRQFRNVRARRWLLEGMLAAERGRRDQALAAYRRSSEVAVAMELPFDTARVTLERARLNDPTLSHDEVMHAAATFDRLGAYALRGQLDAV